MWPLLKCPTPEGRRGGPGRFLREAGGATAIQFAFALPVLIGLLLGTMDGGRLLLNLNTLERLAKDGARFASLRGQEYYQPATQADIATYLDGKAAGLDSSKLTVAASWPDGDNTPGNRVTVTVTYPVETLWIPFAAATFTRSSTLSIMR